MRHFDKPAPKQASANRIRERYLHQLGLQRGSAAAPCAGAALLHENDNTNHVIVISGLPSLPEDRACVLGSHDFSHADGGSLYSSLHDEGSCSGGVNGGKPSPTSALGANSSSLLSTSPHNDRQQQHHMRSCNSSNSSVVADENITSMALACPHSLLKNNHGNNVININNNTTTTLPFSLASWGRNTTSQLSRSAAVALNMMGNNNDHDSVSSAATATTAESSFTATMLSRDWAANNNQITYPPPPSGTASVSSLGDSITSAPVTTGVFFQGRQVFGGGNSHQRFSPPSSYTALSAGVTNQQLHCLTTSSLASALNRFNIDSDCDVSSVASNSIDEQMFDDSASFASRTSHTSEGGGSSTKDSSSHHRRTANKKKKFCKNQRLLDRASAQEQRMMQLLNDRSQKLKRANVVHSQRMSHCSSIGLHLPYQLGGGDTTPAGTAPTIATPLSSQPSCSSSATQTSSIQLMHVHHQATPTNISGSINDPKNNMVVINSSREVLCQQQQQQSNSPWLMSPVLSKNPSFGSQGGGNGSGTYDLGRTPTASNCSHYLKITSSTSISGLLPAGVHCNFYQPEGPINYGNPLRPLGCHPQLASIVPTPPVTSSSSSTSSFVSQSNSSSQVSEMELDSAHVVSSKQQKSKYGFEEGGGGLESSLSVEDDVMEVAVTLSMLGGKRTPTPSNGGGGGMIPRVR